MNLLSIRPELLELVIYCASSAVCDEMLPC